jgi:hypothetical protein
MSDPNREKPFFIGWEPKMPPALKGKVRLYALALVILAVGAGALMAALQRNYGISRYAWTDLKPVEGVFRADPYPHLSIHVPNTADCRKFMLVDEFKESWPREVAEHYDGQYVKLQVGTIYRGDVAMFEGNPGQSVETLDPPPDYPAQLDFESMGRQTLVGEIVDSKCYYGAMNPGNLKTHRACAIVCIKGGIPPVLVVRQKEAAPLYFLLTDPDGLPVNHAVLDYVAEPVEITGEVESQCGLLLLKMDPATIRRL